MSKNIVFDGWLTKSPPMNRLFRTKWRRRWFVLRQSGELPGQYLLDYYADRSCRRLKGTINLDLCEQVDAGLQMERPGNGTLNPRIRGSVFSIQTQQRTYHLEADNEYDMEKWVDVICRVCGLRATDSPNVLETYQNNLSTMSAMNDQYDGDTTGPYIPISECITGVRAQAFTFDPENIVMNTRTLDRVSGSRHHQMYMSQPHIRLNNADLSENDSNLSDEECKSLNASQSNIRHWSMGKSFTKLAISPKDDSSSSSDPPTPPPRPPKTFHKGPKIQEPLDPHDHMQRPSMCSAHGPPPSITRALHPPAFVPHPPALVPRTTDDEDDHPTGHQYSQYCNLSLLPPAVDRALKPRHSSIGHIHHLGHPSMQITTYNEKRSDTLQYLDLDLHSSKPSTPKHQGALEKKGVVIHGKSLSDAEADSAYKTVDFLKTEAFNITRQDAEASRNFQL